MKSEKVRKFLTERGYKDGFISRLAPDYRVANYYRTPRDSNVPDCLSNYSKPQLCVFESFMLVNGNDPYHVFTVQICNEAPQGWIEFKFYALKEGELIERLDAIEDALLKAWASLFD